MCPVVLAGVGDPSISNVPLKGVGEGDRRPLDNVGTTPLLANWPRPRGVINDIAGVESIVSHGGQESMVTLEELPDNLGSFGSMCIL